MEDKLVLKFINKVKDKLSRNKTTYPAFDEYAFSTEEIKTITEQNKEKIQELKQDIFSKKKQTKEKISFLEIEINKTNIDKEKVENHKETPKKEEAENNKTNLISETKEEQIKEEIENKEEQTKNSFVNLDEEYQKIVMNKWKEIDYKTLDKDIIEGKDLLNHNYTITYADDAARFIHNIRKKYEVVICYLIGFNNEKKGIYEKTIFSDKMEDEWKFLNNYIKVLEKIRNFKK